MKTAFEHVEKDRPIETPSFSGTSSPQVSVVRMSVFLLDTSSIDLRVTNMNVNARGPGNRVEHEITRLTKFPPTFWTVAPGLVEYIGAGGAFGALIVLW